MVLSNMQPWQLLLWIVCLEIVSVPIITLIANTMFIGYYKAKESHITRMVNKFSKAFEKTLEEISKKVGNKDGT